MTKTLEPTLDEIREEAAITKRILERVPADKLSWKPHPKSMSLGQLALHVANIPGGLTKLLQLDEFDLPGQFQSAAAQKRRGDSRHT